MNAPPPVSGPANPIVARLQSGEAAGAAAPGPPRPATRTDPATASSVTSAIPVLLFISSVLHYLDQRRNEARKADPSKSIFPIEDQSNPRSLNQLPGDNVSTSPGTIIRRLQRVDDAQI